MGKNIKKLYSFRTDDWLIKKMDYISGQNTRTRTEEITHVLKKHVKEYEDKHGEINITDK